MEKDRIEFQLKHNSVIDRNCLSELNGSFSSSRLEGFDKTLMLFHKDQKILQTISECIVANPLTQSSRPE